MDWVERLNNAIKYIEEHLTDKIEYEELAKLLCCSTYHFQRMFAFMNGVPLSEYIRRRKLSLAVSDIQNDERIVDMLLLLHFVEHFRIYMGLRLPRQEKKVCN